MKKQNSDLLSKGKNELKRGEVQQGEIRFVDHIKFDEEEQDIVPEIYREHRHRFSKQPEDINAYKR